MRHEKIEVFVVPKQDNFSNRKNLNENIFFPHKRNYINLPCSWGRNKGNNTDPRFWQRKKIWERSEVSIGLEDFFLSSVPLLLRAAKAASKPERSQWGLWVRAPVGLILRIINEPGVLELHETLMTKEKKELWKLLQKEVRKVHDNKV